MDWHRLLMREKRAVLLRHPFLTGREAEEYAAIVLGYVPNGYAVGVRQGGGQWVMPEALHDKMAEWEKREEVE